MSMGWAVRSRPTSRRRQETHPPHRHQSRWQSSARPPPVPVPRHRDADRADVVRPIGSVDRDALCRKSAGVEAPDCVGARHHLRAAVAAQDADQVAERVGPDFVDQLAAISSRTGLRQAMSGVSQRRLSRSMFSSGIRTPPSRVDPVQCRRNAIDDGLSLGTDLAREAGETDVDHDIRQAGHDAATGKRPGPNAGRVGGGNRNCLTGA